MINLAKSAFLDTASRQLHSGGKTVLPAKEVNQTAFGSLIAKDFHLRGRHGGRLFAQDMFAGLERRQSCGKMQMVRQANDCRIHGLVRKQIVIIAKCFLRRVFLLKFRSPRFIDIGAGTEFDAFQGARGNRVHLPRPTGADNAEIQFFHAKDFVGAFKSGALGSRRLL